MDGCVCEAVWLVVVAVVVECLLAVTAQCDGARVVGGVVVMLRCVTRAVASVAVVGDGDCVADLLRLCCVCSWCCYCCRRVSALPLLLS